MTPIGAAGAPAETTAGAPIGETLRSAAAALADAFPDPEGVGSPRLEAELLLAEASGLSRTQIVAWPERMLAPAALAAFRALLARRAAGEPLAYIRGRQAFWTLELRVTPDTLIPRPETELLVEIALSLPLALPQPARVRRVADLGTGSGAIAAAVAGERPAWEVLAVERSAATLAVARENFRRLGLTNCLPVRGDWLAAVGPAGLDLILANPPYIPAGDPHLARGDLRREPREALAAGPDGLAAIRAILGDAHRCLRAGGILAVEHGFDQGAAVRELFRKSGFARPETRRDLAGHERVTLAERGGRKSHPAR